VARFLHGLTSDRNRRIFLLAAHPAKVALSNRQPPLRLGDPNWSSCPIAAVRNTRRDRQLSAEAVIRFAAFGRPSGRHRGCSTAANCRLPTLERAIRPVAVALANAVFVATSVRGAACHSHRSG
jgi:hypothetical protein